MIAADFLNEIWGPIDGHMPLYGELRIIKGNQAMSYFYRVVDMAAAAAKRYSNIDGADVYYGVLRRTREQGRAEDCVPGTHVMWADFDAKTFGSKDAALREIIQVAWAPQIIVDSGYGYHTYWLLDQEYVFADAQAVMRGIETAHRSDHCSDQPRILRVPGTFNFKNGDTLPVRVVRWAPELKYPLSAFDEYHAAIPIVRRTPQTSFSLHAGTWTPSPEDAPKFAEGGRNQNLTRLAGIMVSKGMTPDEVEVALSWENEHRCDPPLMAHEVRAIARSVERYRR